MSRRMKTGEQSDRYNTHKQVLRRSQGFCERCGRGGESDHHRKNRSQGGRWSVDNIVRLCGDGTRGCHGWVTSHPEAASLEGYHVKPWQDPAFIPVLIHRKWWARLRTDGGYDQVEPPLRALE